jgi:hypothetical protein
MRDERISKNLGIVKKTLKKQAQEIREIKSTRKDENLRNPDYQCQLYCLKRGYRHLHIAYCEVKGRTRDQIEVPGEFNFVSENWIDKHKKRILEDDLSEEGAKAPLTLFQKMKKGLQWMSFRGTNKTATVDCIPEQHRFKKAH